MKEGRQLKVWILIAFKLDDRYKKLLKVETFQWDQIFKLSFILITGGPVAKTAHSQHRGQEFDPWSGN